MTSPKPTTSRYQLQSVSLQQLNDALADISLRLVALESFGFEVLPPVDIATGAVVGVGLAPFPAMVTGPLGFTPRGVVVLSALNLTDASNTGISTTAVAPWWMATSRGIQLQYVTGLQAVTKYRLILGAFRA